MKSEIESRLLQMIADDHVEFKSAEKLITEATDEALIEASKGIVAIGLLHMLDHDGYACAKTIKEVALAKFEERLNGAMQEWCDVTGMKNPYVKSINEELVKEILKEMENEA